MPLELLRNIGLSMDKIKNKIKKIDRRRQAFKKVMKRKRIYRKIELGVAKRRKAERRFRFYGIGAVAVALLFLFVLFFNIISKGYSAFLQTQILVPVTISEENARTGNYQTVLIDGLQSVQGDAENKLSPRQLYPLISKGAVNELKEAVPETHEIWLPAASSVDMFNKSGGSNVGRLSGSQVEFIKELDKKGRIRKVFNADFFAGGDSREPEMAGILGSVVGSILVIVSCMFLAFPLGTMTAIYLEEFAPKNKLTEFIEININNLAAVPSIVYGILGLMVYLQMMGVPRSASLAGGLTLALMALPVIVIATRTSIRAIPQSIRDGASALGATRLQVVAHHVLPLAMPGIMTGTILSIARVMGETAPLLMIGMVAFIVNVPTGFLEPATALPVQVYLWSDSAEQGFIEKTSAAIIVLLALLVLINSVAVYLRKKFEVRW